MDQVKVVLAALGRHHFWVLCGLVVVVALVIYASASADLSGQYQERTAAINGKVESVQNIGEDPPNQLVIDAKSQEVAKLKDQALRAWEFLYKLQKEKNPWPEELGEDFLNMINSLGPQDAIPIKYLENYHYFIDNHFPALFDIIDVRKEVYVDPDGNVVEDAAVSYTTRSASYSDEYDSEDEDEGGYSGGRSTGTGLETEVRGIVEWSNPEVLALGRDWTSRPTTFQVRLAQEDLWVYEALLRIIRDTNAGATSYHNAAVKRIEAMQIGQAAAAAFATSEGRIIGGGGGAVLAASTTYAGDTQDSSADFDEEEEGGGGGYFGTSGLGNQAALLQGRYVGINGEPLAHNATHPFAEFKLMPVRLILYMDQTKIPDLLVNCANSSMPVEVRRVSLFPGAQGQTLDLGLGTSASTLSSYGGDDDDEGDDYGGEEDDEGGGYGGYGGFGGSAAYSAAAGTRVTVAAADSKDIPVEIQGVIQIFNYPNREKLGTGSAGEGPAETVMPIKAPPQGPTAPPAAGPAAPAPTEPSGTPAQGPTASPPAQPSAPAPTGPSPPADASSPAATDGGT